MAISPYVYPARLDPLNNITPMTYRDGTSMARLLEDIRVYVLEHLPAETNAILGKFFTDFSAALGESQAHAGESETAHVAAVTSALAQFATDNAVHRAEIDALISAINNASGRPPIQRHTLTGAYTLTVDPTWPTDQPVDVMFTQDGNGKRAVTLGPNIEGSLTLNQFPYADTALTLVPGADGVWTVIQPEQVARTLTERAASRAARRPWIGGRVSLPGNADELPGAQYFDETHRLETELKATFDIVNWYAAVNSSVVARYQTEIIPELAKYPDRKVMYALEIFRSNDEFIAEFDARGNVYQYLLSLFTLMRESGTDERVHLAPFHEGNGPGGSYPWQMNDTSNGNSIAKYAACYTRVVQLARDLGVRSKFIQWFLTSNGGGADDSRDISKGFVGDQWVDLIGVSYYNRADITGGSETAVGGTLTRFMRHVEGMSQRNVWICESGCYPSIPGQHDKGSWYSDLIRLVASDQFPRLTALCMFMVDSSPEANKRLDNAEQKRRVGKAMNDARRTTAYGNPSDLTRNLLPRPIAVPSNKNHWTQYKADGLPDLALSITNNVPDNVDKINTSLRITKPYNLGISTDYRVSRLVAPGDVDFELQKTHTTGFWARASYDGWKLGFGVRQSGGNLVAGDSRIELSTQWEYYNTPFATGIDPGSAWHFPHMSFGDNVAAGWLEITDMQIARGSHPTPDVAKILVPRVRDAVDGPVITVNAESADTWILTLGGDRVLNAPVGAAYDGQLMTLRVRQDATGTRLLTRNAADPRWFVSSESMTGNLTAAPFSQTLVNLMYFSDQDKWGIVKVTKMNFT